MKIVIGVIAALAWTIAPANADVYVKVDANGNAIGGAIVCDAETCGANSVYSQLTLNQGESYVLQGYGSVGIGNNNPDTEVKVDIPTQTWTVTTPLTVTTIAPNTPVYGVPVVPVIVETSTVVTDTATVVIDTATALNDTATATLKNVTVSSVYAEIMALLNKIIQLFALLNR
jgi:hypothetical protein